MSWSLKPRGPVNAAMQGYLGLAAASLIGGELLELPAWWAAGGAVLGTVITFVVGLNYHPKKLGWRIGAWLSGGAWVTTTMMTGLVPVTPSPWAALLALVTSFTLTYEWAHKPPKLPPALTGRHHNGILGNGATLAVEGVPRRHVSLAEEWVARIYRISGKGRKGIKVRINHLEVWESGGGFTANLILPGGGIGIEDLNMLRKDLANDANLPKGCAVDFVEGDARRDVIMHVSTVNRLKDTIYHHGDFSPRDIRDGISLGPLRDGSPMTIEVRQSRTLVVGTTGAGKTSTLHTACSELSRCTNNLTQVMDLNGGGIAQAWLRPWLDGKTDRPAIDWAAPCPEEALLMSHSNLAIGIDRKTTYAQLQIDHNDDKLPVSFEVPQVTTILDEGAEVLAETVRDPICVLIRKNIEATARQCRATAVQYMFSALRSTQGMLSSDLLSLTHNRIFMAGGEAKDANYLYDWPDGGVDMRELAGAGSGFVRLFQEYSLRVWRCYRMEPKTHIEPAAMAASRQRPDLDEPSAAVAGPWYETRHERMRWLFSTPQERDHLPYPDPVELPGLFGGKKGDEPVIWHPHITHPAAKDMHKQLAVQEEKAPRPAAEAEAETRTHLSLLRGDDFEDPAAIAARARARMVAEGKAPMPAATVAHATPGPYLVEEVRQVKMGDGDELPEVLRRAIQALRQAPTGRVHSETLAARVGARDVYQLAELLSPLGLKPVKNKFSVGGELRRGYDLRDALDCAKQIITGAVAVPEWVAKWPGENALEAGEETG